MVMAPTSRLAMSSTVLRSAVAGVLSKTRFVAGDEAGANPPTQLAALLQRLSPPPPFHVKVAGAKRVSRCSRVKRRRGRRYVATWERNSVRSQRNQENEDMGRVPSSLGGRIGGLGEISWLRVTNTKIRYRHEKRVAREKMKRRT